MCVTLYKYTNMSSSSSSSPLPSPPPLQSPKQHEEESAYPNKNTRSTTPNGIQLCGRYERKGTCRFGEQCFYAHGIDDIERPLLVTSSQKVQGQEKEEGQEEEEKEKEKPSAKPAIARRFKLVLCSVCAGDQGTRAVLACNTCNEAVCVRCATLCTGCVVLHPKHNPLVRTTKMYTNASDASLHVSVWCPEHAQRTAAYTCTWCCERMCAQCSNGRVEMHDICIEQRLHGTKERNIHRYNAWYSRLTASTAD